MQTGSSPTSDVAEVTITIKTFMRASPMKAIWTCQRTLQSTKDMYASTIIELSKSLSAVISLSGLRRVTVWEESHLFPNRCANSRTLCYWQIVVTSDIYSIVPYMISSHDQYPLLPSRVEPGRHAEDSFRSCFPDVKDPPLKTILGL